VSVSPFRPFLWFAKTLADFEINDIAALPHCSVITLSHVSIYRPVLRNTGSPLARPSEPLTRESGATSTTRRPETSASAAKTRPARQALLGRRPPILVRMATIPHCGHARNRGALAQGWIPFVPEVTKHPTSSWIVQQLRKAFPFGSAPRFYFPSERALAAPLEDFQRKPVR
jgi:hypothetical protein